MLKALAHFRPNMASETHGDEDCETGEDDDLLVLHLRPPRMALRLQASTL
jgi:hypothetical protein